MGQVEPGLRTRKTHTFRLDADVLQRLEELSTKTNASINSLASAALRKYVEWDFVSQPSGNITLSQSLLVRMMDNFSIEQARELGSWASLNVLNDLVIQLFQKKTFTTIIATLALLGKYTGAFSLEHTYNAGKHTLILLPKMGLKWSSFYEEFATGLFRLTWPPPRQVTTSCTENQVIVSITIERAEKEPETPR
jgi:hypothetical protein